MSSIEGLWDGAQLEGDMCYCDLPAERELDDLKRDVIPDEALVRACCWEQICWVRG